MYLCFDFANLILLFEITKQNDEKQVKNHAFSEIVITFGELIPKKLKSGRTVKTESLPIDNAIIEYNPQWGLQSNTTEFAPYSAW